MPPVVVQTIALTVLLGVLVFAVTRPKGLPEAVAAAPGALLLCAVGAVGWGQAWVQVMQMLPTVAFLAGVLMLSHLCAAEGVFAAAGGLMAAVRAGGRSGCSGWFSWSRR